MASDLEPRPPRPTLRQVARLAGVSVTTVSRVLNAEPYYSEESAAKVRTAAAQLGFRVNVLARELRSGAASTTVGLLIGDLANPYWSALARGAERELSARGLRLLTASTDEDPGLEWSLTQDMLDRRVRALMIVPSAADHAYLETERRQGLTVVFIDRPPANILGDTMLLDNAGGSAAAAAHLLKHGHRRIAIVGDPERLYTHRERARGFREMLDRQGASGLQISQRDDARDAQTAEHRVRELLAQADSPTALFTLNNWVTAGALRAIRDLPTGHPIPALIGFDDLDLGDLLGVSVIQHDPEVMGRLAATAALGRLDGDQRVFKTQVVPTTLVARGSGERAPTD